MDRLHARYPFLKGARKAVETADIDLVELIETDSPAVDRGRERLEAGLSEGHTGTPRRSTRIELLSYPIARVLVSLLDDPIATDTYARAEAATARERLEADLDSDQELRSVTDHGLTVNSLLTEFGLAAEVTVTDEGFLMDVSRYLSLSQSLEGEQWRLVNRALDAGRVPIDRPELLALLEEAVVERVSEGLPLPVPDAIADRLEAERTTLQTMLESPAVELGFDTVNPAKFPPCMQALLEQARGGEAIEPPGQFALVGFLAGTDLDADAICDLAGGGLDRETIDYQLAHLRGSHGVEYVPPDCAVMDEYGLCVNRDDRCDRIDHPAEYYRAALTEE